MRSPILRLCTDEPDSKPTEVSCVTDDTVSTRPFFEHLKELFHEVFLDNCAVAMLVLLAAASRAFSVALKGDSGAGKSTLAKRVLELIPQEDVLNLNRVTTAALSRMGQLAVVFSDELIADRNLENIRRQLISAGRAKSMICIDGKPEIITVDGPVAFIDCVPPGKALDIQDSSRVVTLRLADSERQIAHHIAATIRRHTKAGISDQYRWEKLATQSHTELARLCFDKDIEIDIDSRRLMPITLATHMGRRIEQVLILAKSIAILSVPLTPSGVIRCGEDEVRRALHLLIDARAEDDHDQLPEETRCLAQALGQPGGVGAWDKRMNNGWFTIEAALEQLNGDDVSDNADQIIHANKRRGGGAVKFTRRIVTPHIGILWNLNLLERERQGRGFQWRFTASGRAWLMTGSMNSYTQMLAQLDATADSRRND